MTTIIKAGIEDITTIHQLAHHIWPRVYGQMISEEQIAYMLQLMYSPERIQQDMDHQKHYLVIKDGATPVGYSSYEQLDQDRMMLHKLYVSPDIHGKGLGKQLIDEVATIAADKGCNTLQLHVNRHNPAVGFYKKYGFTVLKEQITNIGDGYVMDDYVMVKSI